MSRNRKNSDPQDTSRSPPSQDISATTLGSAFFVPTHPLLLIGTEYTLLEIVFYKSSYSQ